MCQDRNAIKVRVRIPADLSCSGRAKWKKIPIDRCIAPIVEAFQKAGINMRGSCCGHGKRVGYISLEDYSNVRLIINPDETYGSLGWRPPPCLPDPEGGKK